MSSVVLPLRGQCTQVTDNLQFCQCPSFASTLDQHICGWCGHGIHAHVDYVSLFVHQCPAMNCVAYYPKTPRVQACTCLASLIEHMPVVNAYRSLAALPFGAVTPPSNVTPSTGDATNVPFTPGPMPAPSTNGNPSYSYGDVATFTSTPHPVIQMPFTQIDTHSHSEVGNFYGPQYQDDSSSVINNVQDSSTKSPKYYSTTYVPMHDAEAWAGHQST